MNTISRRPLHRSIVAPATMLSSAVLIGAMLIPALGAGASQASSSAPLAITIKASAVHMPAQIAAGMVALTLVNDTHGGPASIDIGRANPGATPAAIAAANASNTLQGFADLTHLLTFVGGPDSVAPGGKETVIVDLRTPGYYGLHLSFDNRQGQNTRFTVTAGTGPSAALPTSALPIAVKDMKIVGLPGTIAAGAVTLKITSSGPSVHEVVLARLAPGKTKQDVANLFKGPGGGHGGPPPWVHVIGGLNMISAHQTAYLDVNLTPGNYIALCAMPDLRVGKHGMPHAAEGMITAFTVS